MARVQLDEQMLRTELQTLQDFLSRPDAYTDSSFTKKNKRSHELETILGLVDQQNAIAKQLNEARQLSDDSDPELAELAKAEVPELEQKATNHDEQLFIMLAPKDPNDDK